MTKTKGKKLAMKDLIMAGAFIALYIVLMFGTVTATGFVPIVYILAPLILSVVLGTVYICWKAAASLQRSMSA